MCSITLGGFIRSGFVYYPLPYMELLPQFDCLDQVTDTWQLCEPDDFCGKTDIEWRYNFDAPTSIHNWVQQLDLAC